MRVAQKDGVDVGYVGKIVTGILVIAHCRCSAQAGMRQRNNDVGACILHCRHVFLRGLDNVRHFQVAFQMLLVPLHNLGRHEADEADANLLLAPIAGGQ